MGIGHTRFLDLKLLMSCSAALVIVKYSRSARYGR